MRPNYPLLRNLACLCCKDAGMHCCQHRNIIAIWHHKHSRHAAAAQLCCPEVLYSQMTYPHLQMCRTSTLGCT